MILGRPSLQRLTLTLRTPLRTAKGELRVREGFVVRIDAEGFSGHGEAMPLPSFGTESLAACAEALDVSATWLERRALGSSVAEIEALLEGCLELSHAPAARHAIESALLDLVARFRGQRVCDLLSSTPRDRVKVNALLGAVDARALGDQASRAVADGFEVLKIKVGGRPVEEDVQRVGAVRESVGATIGVRIDANGAWSLEEAREALRRLGAFSLELCEQPVSEQDLPTLGRLRAQLPCPIAADESVANVSAVDVLLNDPGVPLVDVLVLKPMVLGGPLQAMHLARRALARGVSSYITSTLDGPFARAAATHVAAALPESGFACGLATGHLFESEPDAALPLVRGQLLLADAPGLGLTRRAA